MKTNNLVKLLKDSGQDHEFYPTTNEIIECCYADLNNISRSEFTECAGSITLRQFSCGLDSY